MIKFDTKIDRNKQFVHIMSTYGTFNGQMCPLKNKLYPIEKKKNMRQIIIFSLLTILTISSFSQTLNFEFFNSNGKEFNTKILNEQLEKEYGTRFEEKIILLETPCLKDSIYIQQNKILNDIDAESLQLIFITACAEKEYKGGYHTSIEKAKEIMGENHKFRIRILESGGKILFESYETLSKYEIEKELK